MHYLHESNFTKCILLGKKMGLKVKLPNRSHVLLCSLYQLEATRNCKTHVFKTSRFKKNCYGATEKSSIFMAF